MSISNLLKANTYNVYCNDLAVVGNLSLANDLVFDDVNIIGTTQSVSETTGSLTVAGGVGISKNLYVGGTIYGTVNGSISTTSLHLTDTTQSISTSTGTLIVDGGSGITGNLYVGGIFSLVGDSSIKSTSESNNSSTGALTILGGLGVYKNINSAANITAQTMNVIGSVSSTDSNSGSLIINGGLGISDNINVFGNINSLGTSNLKYCIISSTQNSNSSSSGALIVNGGLGVGGNETLHGTLNFDTNASISTDQYNDLLLGCTTGGRVSCNAAIEVTNAAVDNAIITNRIENYSQNTLIVQSDGANGSVNISTRGVNGAIKLMVNDGNLTNIVEETITKSLHSSAIPFSITDTTASNDYNSGALTVGGGIGANGYISSTSLRVQDPITPTRKMEYTIGSSNDHKLAATGVLEISCDSSLTLSGGSVVVSDTTDASNWYTGALTVSGGIASNGSIAQKGIEHAFYRSNSRIRMNQGNDSATVPTSYLYKYSDGITLSNNGYYDGTYHDQLLSVDQSVISASPSGIAFSTSPTTGANPTVNMSISKTVANIYMSTASTTYSTGSLVLNSGGLGVAGNINSNGYIHTVNTTNATSTSTGALICSGGIGCGDSIWSTSTNVSGTATLGNVLIPSSVNDQILMTLSGLASPNNYSSISNSSTALYIYNGGYMSNATTWNGCTALKACGFYINANEINMQFVKTTGANGTQPTNLIKFNVDTIIGSAIRLTGQTGSTASIGMHSTNGLTISLDGIFNVNIAADSVFNVKKTTDATAANAAACIVSGGLSVNKNLIVGDVGQNYGISFNGGANSLNNYNEYTSLQVTFSSGSGSPLVDIYLNRIGKTVTCMLYQAVNVNANAAIVGTSVIPVAYRMLSPHSYDTSTTVINGGVITDGRITIDSNGTITVYRNIPAVVFQNNSGLGCINCSWLVV
jgi:hypothetical protein